MEYPPRGAASVRSWVIMQSEYRPWKKKKIRRHYSHSTVFTLNYSRLHSRNAHYIRSPRPQASLGLKRASARSRRRPIALINGHAETAESESKYAVIKLIKFFYKKACVARQFQPRTIRASYEVAMKRLERETISRDGDGSRNERKKLSETERKKSRRMCPREYNGPLLRARYPRTMPAPGFS